MQQYKDQKSVNIVCSIFDNSAKQKQSKGDGFQVVRLTAKLFQHAVQASTLPETDHVDLCMGHLKPLTWNSMLSSELMSIPTRAIA